MRRLTPHEQQIIDNASMPALVTLFIVVVACVAIGFLGLWKLAELIWMMI